MWRIFHFFLLSALAASGQQGLPDPVFNKVPFAQWLKGEDDARIRWSLRAFPARLTVHQRLQVVIVVQVDGAEFVKRKEPGQVVAFVEIRDSDNRVFRTHNPLKFDELSRPADLAAVNLQEYTFIKPGDYQVAAAIYDAVSKEHSLKRMKLHVPEIGRDPLPAAARDLPAVEFVMMSDPPDRWYLPEISSRLFLPVETRRPVRVEVVVNESPTEMATRRTGRVSTRNMGSLIPALKVISQMDIRNGTLNVTLLDLERRKVSFAQEDVHKLDWARLRGALVDNDPNQINVHALANHEQNAQFFVTEIRKRLESTESNGDVPLGLSAEAKRVLIVLSGPMAFPKGQDLRPIEATPEPGTRVFYIRYNPPVPGPGFGMFPGRGGGRGGPLPGTGVIAAGRGPLTEDSLARTLKPLAPRLFDVTTPTEFRTALGSIMSEISQLK